MERLKALAPIEWAVVCEEQHEDGSPHLHLCGSFKEKQRYRSSDWADSIGGKHGSYEPMRNLKKSVEYVTKAGSYIAEGIDVEEYLKKGVSTRDAVARALIEGSGIDDLLDEHPGYVLEKRKQILDFINDIGVKRARQVEVVTFTPPTVVHPGYGWEAVVDWLNLNMTEEPRPFKQKQLWLFGPPNVGKTTLLDGIRQQWRTYEIPISESWDDHFDDRCFDVAVVDEFRGQRPVTWMNRFTDGSTFPISR